MNEVERSNDDDDGGCLPLPIPFFVRPTPHHPSLSTAHPPFHSARTCTHPHPTILIMSSSPRKFFVGGNFKSPSPPSLFSQYTHSKVIQ